MRRDAFAPHGRALVDFFNGDPAAAIVVHTDLGECDELPVRVWLRDPPQFWPLERAALDLCRGVLPRMGRSYLALAQTIDSAHWRGNDVGELSSKMRLLFYTMGGPDHNRLFQIASSQAAYFTAAQARECGIDRRLIWHHVNAGKYLRVRSGLYRLAHFPSSRYEDVMAAWLSLGRDKAVVSHETALQIHDLSDVVPLFVHLTVSRGARGGRQRRPPAVKIHTTTRSFHPGEILEREGMRVTSPARTIVDAAEAGTSPDQVALAVQEALDRGLLSRGELDRTARGRGTRVLHLVQDGLAGRRG